MAEIFCEIQEQLAFVTISNPGKRNALNSEMWQTLHTHFVRLSANENIRCVILQGKDGHFTAGADIQEFATVRNTLADGMKYHNQLVYSALQSISNCVHPVIASIDGSCVGGGLSIALACDIRIATTKSKFGIPINRLGFPLAPRELQSLMNIVGKSIALEILLEGRIYNSIEAKQKGLVQRITDELHTETLISAEYICAGAPLAAKLNKQMIKRLTVTPEPLSDDEYKIAFSFLETKDYQEGVFGFLGKHEPKFTGN